MRTRSSRRLTSLAGKASKEVMQLSAGPLGLAFGGEVRKEKFDFSASAALQAGDVSGYGGNFLPTKRSRDVGAVFGEANIPIVKNLEANVAVRYDHYEGVGSSTTPKASLRWQPMPQLLLRTSWGEGFRAPSLQDLYLPMQTSVTPVGLSDPDRCPVTNNGNDCQTQFNVQLGGEPKLKPEKSKNFTLGAVLEPVTNVSFGIDYFSVRLENTIVNGVNPAIILGDTTQYASLITRAPQTPADIAAGIPGSITSINQININLGTTKTSGLDFDLKWRIPTADMGRFTIGGTATYFIEFDTSNPDGSFTGNVDRINAATGGVIPRFKSYLSIDWTRGPFGLMFAQNYQKHYHDLAGYLQPARAGRLQIPHRQVVHDLRHAGHLRADEVVAADARCAQHLQPGSAVHQCRRPDLVPERLRPAVRRPARPLHLRPRDLLDGMRGTARADRRPSCSLYMHLYWAHGPRRRAGAARIRLRLRQHPDGRARRHQRLRPAPARCRRLRQPDGGALGRGLRLRPLGQGPGESDRHG